MMKAMGRERAGGGAEECVFSQSYALLNFNYLDFLMEEKQTKKEQYIADISFNDVLILRIKTKNNKFKNKRMGIFFPSIRYISSVKVRIFHIEK